MTRVYKFVFSLCKRYSYYESGSWIEVLPIQTKFSADKMYYIISQENAKITNKQKTQTEDRHFSQENRSPH